MKHTSTTIHTVTCFFIRQRYKKNTKIFNKNFVKNLEVMAACFCMHLIIRQQMYQEKVLFQVVATHTWVELCVYNAKENVADKVRSY